MRKWHPDLEHSERNVAVWAVIFWSVKWVWFLDKIRKNRRVLFSHSFTPSSLVNAHFAGLVYTGLERQLLLSDSFLGQKVGHVVVFTYTNQGNRTHLQVAMTLWAHAVDHATVNTCAVLLRCKMPPLTWHRLSVYARVSFPDSGEAKENIYCSHLQCTQSGRVALCNYAALTSFMSGIYGQLQGRSQLISFRCPSQIRWIMFQKCYFFPASKGLIYRLLFWWSKLRQN